MILDWGCGPDKIPGAVGMDNAALPGVDFVHDLMDIPYPFPTASADEIYLNHIIEHFILADSQRILAEARRVLRPSGVVHIRVPHVFTVAAWADPTHKAAFTFESGKFFDRRSPRAYYRETESTWELVQTRARVTWFDWKRYRLRQLDNWLSRLLTRILNWLLLRESWTSGADWLVRAVPMYFVEIQWDLTRPGGPLMHIVLANQWYPPESGWGGVAMWNYTMARAYRDLGHRVTVMARRESEQILAEKDANGIRVQRLLVGNPYRLRRLPILGRYVRSAHQLAYSWRLDRALLELHRRDPIDIVEFAEVNAEGYFFARKPIASFVVRCHTPTFILKKYYTPREIPYDTAIISRAERSLIRRAPALTAPSHDMARVIAETTGVPLDRITVVPNALTLSDFRQINDSSTQASNEIYVLFVGRLERAKGVMVLAQAILRVVRSVRDARFVFVGGDRPTEKGTSQRAELETRFAQAGMIARVEFTGEINHEMLLHWYQRADICVVPSMLYESFSYTCAQPMAAGKPVIASRIGGIPETVDDGVTGILVRPGDAEELSHAIIHLIRDPGLREKMGNAGLIKVARDFDPLRIAEQTLGIYERAIATNK